MLEGKEYEVIRKSEIKVTRWSGGTTSELFIFPRTASFKTGNFDVRISIATVEVEESEFTPLPDIKRTLLVLDGELKLKHKGHHSSHLNKFEQDSFDGGWTTQSFGRATDFNVMTKNNTNAFVEVVSINASEKISDFNSDKLDFLHVLTGEIIFNQTSLTSGESIVLYKTLEKENRIVKAVDPVVLIRVRINLASDKT